MYALIYLDSEGAEVNNTGPWTMEEITARLLDHVGGCGHGCTIRPWA